MKEGLKKPLRAFALFALIEVVLYLIAATAAWAVVWHDAKGLDQAFFAEVGSSHAAQAVAAVLGICVAINVVAMIAVFARGEKPVALAILVMTSALASLFFLPIRFAVYGLGGVAGLFAAYKLLRGFWSVLSWPFRKMFRRTPKDAKPVPQAVAAVKPKPSKAP